MIRKVCLMQCQCMLEVTDAGRCFGVMCSRIVRRPGTRQLGKFVGEESTEGLKQRAQLRVIAKAVLCLLDEGLVFFDDSVIFLLDVWNFLNSRGSAVGIVPLVDNLLVNLQETSSLEDPVQFHEQKLRGTVQQLPVFVIQRSTGFVALYCLFWIAE
jgi:hypothetical protein